MSFFFMNGKTHELEPEWSRCHALKSIFIVEYERNRFGGIEKVTLLDRLMCLGFFVMRIQINSVSSLVHWRGQSPSCVKVRRPQKDLGMDYEEAWKSGYPSNESLLLRVYPLDWFFKQLFGTIFQSTSVLWQTGTEVHLSFFPSKNSST